VSERRRPARLLSSHTLPRRNLIHRAFRPRRLPLAVVVAVAALWGASAASAATAPALVGSVSNSTSLSGATAVAVSGHYAYTASYWPGELTAVDLSNPGRPTVTGNSPLLQTNLIAASTVNVAGGYAFVVSKNRNTCTPLPCIGTSTKTNDDGNGNSLSILDIHTNPAQPSLVGKVREPSPDHLFGAYGVAVSGHYAYVAAQGLLGGQPTTPDTQTGAFAVINIANPAGPSIAASIDNSSLSGHNYLEHADAVAVSGNYAYVAGFGDDRLTVINISNPTAPTIVTSLRDPTNLASPSDVAVSGNYAYVTNQTGTGRLTVVDVSNPSSPKVVGSVASPSLNMAYRVRVRNSLAYVSAPNAQAVDAIDVSDPTNPRLLATVTDAAHLNQTTGLDLSSSGPYLIASSPLQSTQHNPDYPPYPFQTGGPTETGTISVIDLDPAGISAAISPASEPPPHTTQTSANFSFSVNDTVSTVRCRLDGGAYSLCTSPTTQHYAALAVGTAHTFTVQATDAAGITATSSYTWAVDIPPVNTSRPTIHGTAAQGQTLTVSNGSWTGPPAGFTYRWQRCNSSGANCSKISNATNPTYRPVAGDVGSTLEVAVTASNSAGSSSVDSARTATVSSLPAEQTRPRVSGTARQAGRLSGTNGHWSGNPSPSFAYRWQRCNSHGRACSFIRRQSTTRYTITAGDVGSELRFVVLATNRAGTSSASSAPTAVVQASGVTVHGALGGIGAGRPALRLKLAAHGKSLPPKKAVVALPHGLGFSAAARILTRDVTVEDAHHRHLRFSASRRRGSLVITLARAATSVQIAITAPAISASRSFARSVKQKKTTTVSLTITVTNSRGAQTRARLTLRPA
jgi:hypothetical protein